MHNDQANTLRMLMQEKSRAQRQHQPQVISVSSGKGGVGKTCFVAHLGTRLARMGYRVMLIDGDFGLANLDIILNAQTEITVEQILSGKATVQSAILGIEPGLWLLPAGTGISELRATERAEDRAKFLSLLQSIPWEMDFVIIDGGAGIHDQVLSLQHPDFISTVVMTPEPTSFTDAYGMIKILNRDVGIENVAIVVNQVADEAQALRCFQKLNQVVSNFLGFELNYFGHWKKDPRVIQSVMNRKILLDLDERSESESLAEIADEFEKRLKNQHFSESAKAPGTGFESPFAGKARRMTTASFWNTILGEVNA